MYATPSPLGAAVLSKHLAAFATWARASAAGGIATLCDLSVLFVLTELAHLSPRAASVPALLCGGIVNFFANRHFAFRASKESLARQAALYIFVELLALMLNGLLYDTALRLIPLAAHYYPVTRILAGNVIFLCWSYPLWRRVFRVRAADTVSI